MNNFAATEKVVVKKAPMEENPGGCNASWPDPSDWMGPNGRKREANNKVKEGVEDALRDIESEIQNRLNELGNLVPAS